MIFLSDSEKAEWRRLADEIEAGRVEPGRFTSGLRTALLPAFHYFVGTRLGARSHEALGQAWIDAGTGSERQGLSSNTFLSSFLRRHGGGWRMPAVCFEDPAPFVHFSGVPPLEQARRAFLDQCAASLPVFREPLRILDIGTGDGRLLARLLERLLESGVTREIGSIHVVEASEAMCDLATRHLREAFPGARIDATRGRIQEHPGEWDERFHVALSSLAFHHMPFEDKVLHLGRLAPHVEHFVIFELGADHDTPEQASPELALSIFQSYGRMIDFVFAHDAPIRTAVDCVDNFLMTEVMSFVLQPRGARTDYHMLRSQWHEAFRRGLGKGFACLCESTASSDTWLDLFTMHYGR